MYPKGSKFGNKKTECMGFSFASKLEKAVYDELYKLYLIDEIISIQLQPSVYMTKARILMKPDFKCVKKDGTYYYVEAKGFVGDVYAIKRRLWPFYGDGELHVYMGSFRSPFLKEIIKPREF